MIFGRWIVGLLAVAIIAGTACGAGGPSAKVGYSSISPQDLQAQMDSSEKPVIVDLREPDLYKAGHITGAKNIPFEEFDRRFDELDPQAKIALVCHSGPMGEISGTLLAERGYSKVSNVRGGMAAWRGKLER